MELVFEKKISKILRTSKGRMNLVNLVFEPHRLLLCYFFIFCKLSLLKVNLVGRYQLEVINDQN